MYCHSVNKNKRKVHRLICVLSLTCLVRVSVHSSEKFKVLSYFVNNYSVGRTNKESKYNNSKNSRKEVVNEMVQNAVDDILQGNLGRKISTKV